MRQHTPLTCTLVSHTPPWDTPPYPYTPAPPAGDHKPFIPPHATVEHSSNSYPTPDHKPYHSLPYLIILRICFCCSSSPRPKVSTPALLLTTVRSLHKTLHCTALHTAALHCTALHCTALLHCTAHISTAQQH